MSSRALPTAFFAGFLVAACGASQTEPMVTAPVEPSRARPPEPNPAATLDAVIPPPHRPSPLPPRADEDDSAQMAVPSPMAAPCQSDGACGTHRCNLQYQRCAFPCMAQVDCVAGNTCTIGICVPTP